MVFVPAAKQLSKERKDASRLVMFLVLADSAVLEQDLLRLEVVFKDLVGHQTRKVSRSASFALCLNAR